VKFSDHGAHGRVISIEPAEAAQASAKFQKA
jgi:hypothetical protein